VVRCVGRQHLCLDERSDTACEGPIEAQKECKLLQKRTVLKSFAFVLLRLLLRLSRLLWAGGSGRPTRARQATNRCALQGLRDEASALATGSSSSSRHRPPAENPTQPSWPAPPGRPLPPADGQRRRPA
jgi:hypothetical protein